MRIRSDIYRTNTVRTIFYAALCKEYLKYMPAQYIINVSVQKEICV